MSFKTSPGYNILIPKHPSLEPHLWIILTEPIGNPPEVVIVSISKKALGKDHTVELNSGEHSFIRKPTIVFYDDIRLAKADDLIKASRIYKTLEPFTGEILKRIQKGVFLSDRVPEKILNRCRELLPDLSNDIN